MMMVAVFVNRNIFSKTLDKLVYYNSLIKVYHKIFLLVNPTASSTVELTWGINIHTFVVIFL